MPAHVGELSFVSSCRRAQLCSERSAHAGAQLCQLMEESSALSSLEGGLSSVSSCKIAELCSKRSAHARAQLCQLM